MERYLRQFLATALIFGTFQAVAAPQGDVKDFNLKTTYLCHTNGVVVRNSEKVISRGGRSVEDIQYVAKPGHNQTLTFGRREYMIWPRVTGNTFEKNLNVLAREENGKFKIVQEIGLGDAQKTKTNVSLTVNEGSPEEKPVSCKIELEWIKKTL